MRSHISRCLTIGAKRLFVLDGMFSAEEIGSLHQFLGQLPYRLNDIDSAETAYSRHWKAELPSAMASQTPLLRRCVEVTRELFPDNGLKLKRTHSNLHLYGDIQFPHFDLPGGVTTLYYANAIWDEKWMGETVFYDDNREPLYIVAPRPGRVALFDAEVLHRAGVPSRECFEPRISVAFKFTRS